MSHTGSNASDIRAYNRSLVLKKMLRAGETSRVQLAQDLGLSAQAISNIVRALLLEGLVVVAGKDPVQTGKPRTLLRIEPRSRFAVGIHLDPAVTTTVLTGLTGEVLKSKSFGTPDPQDQERVISLMSHAIEDLLAEAQVPRDRLLGIGVTAPGPVDLASGVVVNPPHLAGWEHVELRDALSRATGADVELTKDVVAAAAAEAWRLAAEPSLNARVIYIGTGIGVSAVIDGRVVSGATGNAGEVGHVIVESGPEAVPCWCGQAGCLTVTASPNALLARADAAGLQLPGDSVTQQIVTLFALAQDGDPKAERIVHSALRGVRKLGQILAAATDPDRMILVGPFAPLYEEAFVQFGEVEGGDTGELGPSEVELSPLGTETCAVGAAALVLERFLSAGAELIGTT